MPVLALDTSVAVAVAVVADTVPDDAPLRAGSGVLAARRVQEPRRHAELLAPLIVEVLRESGVDRRDLTAVVVGTGPAPFTGLRAGLVTARTFALALGIPVHGVSSLDALAAEAASELGLPTGSTVLVATDARRHEVYWARYRVTGTAHRGRTDSAHDRAGAGAGAGAGGLAAWQDGPPVVLVEGPGVARPADLATDLADLRPDDAVVGRGAALYAELVPHGDGRRGDDGGVTGGDGTDGARVDRAGIQDPDPSVLARLALARLASGESLLPTVPLYLRRPDAVPSMSHKRAIG
ncbi:tRNA threonylcarbamoyladenosine biosynthesis protein TsaB [mine drainage metagenome]|uniref:tRNA threonylcarbamoyladenosine biosynthesis protein TsaB n=1 Tax=mine drainage metagenome TaxID=410659 RepID=A0A1J5PYG7_9ZZZZ